MKSFTERMAHARATLANRHISANAYVIASNLFFGKQDTDYWYNSPTPVRPEGRVRFEVARQFATFLAPLAGVVAMGYAYGMDGFLFSLPFAFLLGYALDEDLEQAVKKSFDKDREWDRGRFDGAHRLAFELGLPVEAVTFEVVTILAYEHDKRKKQRKIEEENKRIFDQKTTEAYQWAIKDAHARSAAGLPPRNHSGRGHGARVAATAAAGAAAANHGLSFADVADADGVIDPVHIGFDNNAAFGYVNPASGLPMSDIGIGVDVGGNPFGSNFN